MLLNKQIKERTCKVCRVKFIPLKPLQVVCGLRCAQSYAWRVKTKTEVDQAKAERKEIKAKRESIKTRAQWMREAQTAFNQFIRLRDQLAGHPCISSGQPLDWSGNNVDAGHYRSRGSAPHLRFDERNCHAQSKKDNRYLSGNAVDYRIGLIARIGLEAVESLEADQTPKKYTIAELRAIKAHYVAKLKEMKNAN